MLQDNASAHAAEEQALESDLNQASQDLSSFTSNPRPVLTDVDFYEDMSHLNDTQLIDGLVLVLLMLTVLVMML